MFFINWLNWLYSFFVIPSPTKQTTTRETSIICEQNSAKQEVDITMSIPEEIIITSLQLNTDKEEKLDEKRHILFENQKLIEKIRSYGILEEYEYKYIKELPNEQLSIFFRNLQ